MSLNIYLRLVILLLCSLLFTCSHKTALKQKELTLTLTDSVSHSSHTVSAQVCSINNQHFFYLAGEGKKIQVYHFQQEGKLKLVEQYPATEKNGGIRALTHVKVKESDYLLAGNKADNSLDVYSIKRDGKLLKLNAIIDSDSTFLDEIVTIQIAKHNDRNFIYAGGLDKGMSCFEFFENGALKHIQSIADNDTLSLHGIIGMSFQRISKGNFLVTGAFFDGSISSFKIAENGMLENVSNVKDDEKLFLNGAFPVNSVRLKDQTFLLVSHRHNLHYSPDTKRMDYHGDGVNVFTIDGQGKIQLQSLLKDDSKIKLKGSTRIEIIKKNEKEALVFIATRDDNGLQICSLKQDGVLRPIKEIELDYSIYNGMTLKKINDRWYLFLGAYAEKKIEVYQIHLN